MTDEQYQIAQALAKASMLPGSWEKRFARTVGKLPIDRPLSDKQAEWLARLAWKYHRQMPFNVAKVAGPKPIMPNVDDLKKLQAWNAGKAR